MKSFLYLIVLSDTHYYGGRSSSPKVRWQHHKRALGRGSHVNPHMQAVFNLHGRFEPRVIGEFESEAEATEAEQTWLNEHFGKPGCVNLTSSSRSPRAKGSKLRPETRAKIAESQKGNRHRLGCSFSEESRAKISASKLGHSVSASTRTKIAEANARRVVSTETREKLRTARRACLEKRSRGCAIPALPSLSD